jgi:hypothetical protein
MRASTLRFNLNASIHGTYGTLSPGAIRLCQFAGWDNEQMHSGRTNVRSVNEKAGTNPEMTEKNFFLVN